MIEQLKTIRAALEIFESVAGGPHSASKADKALTAVAQLEAMAGEQEPVAWIRGSGIEMLKLENGGCATVYASEGMSNHSSPLYAAPVAQQPQAEAVPSPTAGMNMAQRILHVGGRNNAAGYVEFGSVQAVEALVRQVLRDLPKPRRIPDHELVTMYDERPTSDREMIEFAREVERRHGIGVQPQHITDGSPCWCNPDVAYTDPETGASVIVHRRPQ